MLTTDEAAGDRPQALQAEFARQDEAARYLGRHPSTLQRWRRIGTGPKWRHMGAHVQYLTSDLREYVENLPVGGKQVVR